MSEEDDRLEKLYDLSQEQLAQRVQSCKTHPWFNQWVLEVLEPQTAEEWNAVRQFGKVPQVACEEVWDFENWVMAKEKAGDPKIPEPEMNTNEKEKAKGDTEQQTKEAEKPQEKETEMTAENETMKAVESNLLRPSTCDLASPPATPVAAPHVVSEDLPPGEAAAEEERKLKEEQKKKRHAQWVKFMRTFESSARKTPDEIKALGVKAQLASRKHGDVKPLQDLFGQWLEAGGDWQKSKVFIESTNKEGTVDTDTRGWVTLAELEHKMGHVGAESMVNYLEQNRPDQCRDHPDAPGVKECRQYKVLVKDEEEKKKEDFISKRFSLQEDDSSDSSMDARKQKGSGGDKSKKAKKEDKDTSKKLEKKVEKACKDAGKKLEDADNIDLTKFPSENIKKAVESEVSTAVDTVKQHMLSVQKLDLQKVSEDLVSQTLATLATAVNVLGELTKSSPKRKNSASEPKAKAKASSSKKPKK